MNYTFSDISDPFFFNARCSRIVYDYDTLIELFVKFITQL